MIDDANDFPEPTWDAEIAVTCCEPSWPFVRTPQGWLSLDDALERAYGAPIVLAEYDAPLPENGRVSRTKATDGGEFPMTDRGYEPQRDENGGVRRWNFRCLCGATAPIRDDRLRRELNKAATRGKQTVSLSVLRAAAKQRR